MTIEEKAKAYDKAIKTAKNLYNSVFVNNDVLEQIFPELDDERTRNEILAYIGARQGIDLETHNRWCAYLEKRETVKKIRYELDAPLGQDINGRPIYFEDLQNSADNTYPPSLEEAVRLYYDTYGNGKGGFDHISLLKFQDIVETFVKDYGQKPAKWSEEDEKMLNSCISSIEEAKENRYAYKETDGDTSYDKEISWLKSRLMNLKKKNEDVAKLCSNEWSEEEMKVLDSIIDDYEKAAKSFCGYNGKIGFLKAIRDGEYDLSKQEWSEEDEKNFEEAISYIKDDALKDFIKSICRQPKVEWSQEDTKMLEATIAFVKHCPFSRIGKGKNNVLAWLKALRSQPHTVSIKNATMFGKLEYERGVKDGIQSEKSRQWKPSEEQILAIVEALKYIPNNKEEWTILENLMHDLQNYFSL